MRIATEVLGNDGPAALPTQHHQSLLLPYAYRKPPAAAGTKPARTGAQARSTSWMLTFYPLVTHGGNHCPPRGLCSFGRPQGPAARDFRLCRAAVTVRMVTLNPSTKRR